MAIMSVRGFYDMHVHTGPAPFRRIGDTIDIARWCAEAGMAGMVAKSHFESTISKAHHAQREVPDFRVFAAVVLNRGIGGINPVAVYHALQQGAKVVWMPTIDAQHHAKIFGHTGTFGFASYTIKYQGTVRERAPLTCLEKGKLTEDTKEIVDTVADLDKRCLGRRIEDPVKTVGQPG